MAGLKTLSNSSMLMTALILGSKTLPNPTLSTITIRRQSFASHLAFRCEPQRPRKMSINADWNGNGNGNRDGNNGLNNGNGESNGNGISSDEEDDESRRKNGVRGFNLRWAQLLLDPDPDNVLAVGLTGLLTWASVQVVWQLLVVSFSIVIAGLKYSLVAALLIFILIALL